MKQMLAVVGVIMLLVASVPVSADVGAQDLGSVNTRIAELEKMFKDLAAQNKDMKSQIGKLENENMSLKNQLITSDGKIASVAKSLESVGVPTEVVASKGIVIGASVTQVTQSVFAGGGSSTRKKADAAWTADIDFTKEFENGMVYANLAIGEGDGSSVSGVNADAGSSSTNAQIDKWFYEHYFLEGDVAVTFGKIDATDYFSGNEYTGDECTQFLNANIDGIGALNAPGNTYGVRVGWQATDMISLNAGFIDGNENYLDVTDDVYSFGEVALSTEFVEGLPGNYRLFGWHSNNAHTELKDSGRKKKNDLGVGISFDQALTDDVGLFLTAAWADPSVNANEFSWASGVQVGGALWSRDADTCGLAVAQAIGSSSYEKQGGAFAADNNETVFEMYYNYVVNDHLIISPNLQLIANPSDSDEEGQGTGAVSTRNIDDSIVAVAGLRTHVTF